MIMMVKDVMDGSILHRVLGKTKIQINSYIFYLNNCYVLFYYCYYSR